MIEKNKPTIKHITGHIVTIALLVCLLAQAAPADGGTSKQKRLLEEVQVTNALVTVRVFHKGKPVDNLQKNHFKIFENGKLRNVNSAYMKRKQLKTGPRGQNAPGTEVRLPRLFVLVFNISDYRLNIFPAVQRFFNEIVRPGDRLIVMSNRFFLKDHKIYDPAAEKRRIIKIIEIEMKYAKGTVNEIEKTVNSFIDEYNDLIAIKNARAALETGTANNSQQSQNNSAQPDDSDPDGLEQTAIKQFVAKYCTYVVEVKNSFLKIPLQDYIELAEYLKEQKLEKWVLNFYQIPRFPQPDFNTDFERKIRQYGHSMDVLNALVESQNLPINAISRAFVNSGATFNTVLMKYQGEAFENLASQMSYSPLSNDSESILRRISKLTGGTVMRTNNLDSFYEKVSAKEDIYYVLAYNTQKSNAGKKKVRVQVWDNTQRNYKVLYDNKKRTRAYRKAEKKIMAAKQDENPVIRLNHVIYGGGILRLMVSNYKMNRQVPPNNTAPPGNFRVRLQILNQRSRVVSYKEKAIETAENQVFVGIKLNELTAGHYDAIVMVEDILTGEQDLAIQEVVIRKAAGQPL